MEKPKRRIRAVDISWMVIRALRDHGRAGVTQLADDLEFSKSTIHQQLQTLRANELVVKENGTYRLSLTVLEFAQLPGKYIENLELITSEVDRVAQMTGEAVTFAIEEHGWVIYVHQTRGEDAVETRTGIGSKENVHSTALGKAIISRYPTARVTKLIDKRGLPRRSRNTITSREELMDQLDRFDEQKYAIDDEENIEGIRCVAVPVHDDNEDGEVMGALSVAGPRRRMSMDRMETELKNILFESVNVIEVNSKFS